MTTENSQLFRGWQIDGGYFRLEFDWDGPEPRAGQFFMARPRSPDVFMGRPLSVMSWVPSRPPRGEGSLVFLVAPRGRGTRELVRMRPRAYLFVGGAADGERAEITGPLGNAWTDFLGRPSDGPVALVGGGVGIAPLVALMGENRIGDLGYGLKLHAGFATDPRDALDAGAGIGALRDAIVATEDGTLGLKGRIPDFLEPEKYAAVCACGPEPMMKAVAEKCAAASVPCFVSMERRMACGVGACLGCTVKTSKGNRRCCADGPIFDAAEVIFDE